MPNLICAILTISDTRTLQDDKSGDLLQQFALADGHTVAERDLVRAEALTGDAAGPGAAAHARGHEDHVCARDRLIDHRQVFKSGASANLWIGASAETVGQGSTDL